MTALHECMAPFVRCACENRSLCLPLSSQPKHETVAIWYGYTHNYEWQLPGYSWIQTNDWRKMDFTKITTVSIFSHFIPTELVCTAHRFSVRVVLGEYIWQPSMDKASWNL